MADRIVRMDGDHEGVHAASVILHSKGHALDEEARAHLEGLGQRGAAVDRIGRIAGARDAVRCEGMFAECGGRRSEEGGEDR